jgi:TonB family protein
MDVSKALVPLNRPALHWRKHGVAAAAFVAGVLCLTTPALADGPPVSLEAALIKHRQDRLQAATSDLEVLANRGDARAQYFLGLAYLKGEGAPRDLARGYAWLLTASEHYDGQFGISASDEAQSALRQIAPKLAGSDLIHGDQFAAEFRRAHEQRLEAARSRARSALLAVIDGADPTAGERRDNGGPYSGCALDPQLRDCPPAQSTPSDNCKGPIVEPDSNPLKQATPLRMKNVEYPVEARRKAWEGNVPLTLHVGRNGQVCQVMLTMSSGVPDLDLSALKAAKQWQFTPPALKGEPVEVIDTTWVTFQISEYVMQ